VCSWKQNAYVILNQVFSVSYNEIPNDRRKYEEKSEKGQKLQQRCMMLRAKTTVLTTRVDWDEKE
jgi:hypothetical protein